MNRPDRNVLIAIAATIAMIAYGSLYPFDFVAQAGVGPLTTLLRSWDKAPGRGDFISNILLYMPLGFLGGIRVGPRRVGPKEVCSRLVAARIGGIILLAAVLSLSIELLQYYDVGRDTEATDFYANVLGATLGAFGGRLFGRDIRWSFLNGIPANPAPTLLLMAWLGYRLYPYVPTTNLHKYWDALKPLLLRPSAPPYAIFRHVAVWTAICVMLERIAQRRQAATLFVAFACLVLGASILIISVQLTLPQLAGMILAFWIWRLTPARRRTPAAAMLLMIYVAAARLEPFRFASEASHFTWVPFLSFMQGSIDLDVQSFCEKFFLYGALIWLLVQAGAKLGLATCLVAGLLFVTSRLEIYLPGRSAEITDALMALGIGGSMSLLEVDQPGRTTADTLTGRLKPFRRADRVRAGQVRADQALADSPP